MSTPAVRAPSRVTAGRVVIAILIAAMVSMWIYVLFLAFGPGRQVPPDRLSDPTFSIAAEQRCRETIDQIAVLPRAIDTPDAVDRAAVVTQANGFIEASLNDLDRLVPDGEDGVLVRAWLADWRTYLADRVAYATALRADSSARLLVSPKDHAQVTEYLDAFAGDNRMPACATPLDV